MAKPRQMILPPVHTFFGLSPEFVLILAGIHNSEQSGVEIANWIRTKLGPRSATGVPTRYGAIVIPQVFPEESRYARESEMKSDIKRWNEPHTELREKIRDVNAYPARHFPPPGMCLDDWLGKAKAAEKKFRVNGNPVTLLPEIAFLIRLIEKVKPIRIVSIHGKMPLGKGKIPGDAAAKAQWEADNRQAPVLGANFPGIFVDPRYKPGAHSKKNDLEEDKFNKSEDPAFPQDSGNKRFDSAWTNLAKKDDWIAREAAKKVNERFEGLRALYSDYVGRYKDGAMVGSGFYSGVRSPVGGNHLNDTNAVVHYAKEGGTPPDAYSLGDWGPVEVTKGSGQRPGAPVFTIETMDNHESWAFEDGIQLRKEDHEIVEWLLPKYVQSRPFKFNRDRSIELQAYADGIIDSILELEDPK